MQDWMIVVVDRRVVIFGATKLPRDGPQRGSAQTEFKKGLKEGATEADGAQPARRPVHDRPPPPRRRTPRRRRRPSSPSRPTQA